VEVVQAQAILIVVHLEQTLQHLVLHLQAVVAVVVILLQQQDYLVDLVVVVARAQVVLEHQDKVVLVAQDELQMPAVVVEVLALLVQPLAQQ
jgi:hypothetical protein